ncbi:N-acetylmuramoyl-L-alanine amidase [Cellulomonas sp. S1-8]|uniref:N-acetylmuramoyl-L-alanine amidase n=1 Tax=Cellulomonas sp. S1-8 TaxID=2904790 RepID=UPI002243C64B|nr:N-acetylmuramoyl-L-alanine amidase [Cellulomonas sp. S1-8]UZN01922.1 N-acetylmuramoyl-L-alanine amidase [Cellulomonas sp. S1-8]
MTAALLAGVLVPAAGVPVAASAVAAAPEASDAAAGTTAEASRPLSVQELDLTGTAPAAEAGGEQSRALSVPVEADVLTQELDTDAFSVLGVTWDAGPTGVTVDYRVRVDGQWTDWQQTEGGDVAADDDRAESGLDDARDGTDPIVAVGADGLQLRADAAEGTVTGLKAVLVDPGVRTTDATTVSAVPVPGAPAMIDRAGWGADESLRTCSPDLSTTVRAAAVHHSASSNSYGAADVPAIIRGFYAYHTRPESDGGRGWCDIGYNFLVDKFGRLFEGRAGGVTASVVGVHTGGFNSQTFGIAAIGEYGAAGVPDPLADALASLIAWKFSIHGIRAGVDISMVSGGGASRFPAGTVVSMSTIFGHRDAQTTSCPGQNLYNLLPYLRTRVAELANAAVDVSPRGVWDAVTTGSGSFTVTGWALDPQTPDPIVVEVWTAGVPSTVLADLSRPDVAAVYPGLGDRHGFRLEVPVAAGSWPVCLAAVNVADGTTVSLGCRTVTVRNAAPVGVVDAVAVSATGVVVTGWTLDPDSSASTQAHIYIGGVGVAVAADLSRPDIAAVYGKGDRHGFRHERALPVGEHEVCTFGTDAGSGPATLLDCRRVVVGTPVPRTPPVGAIDALTATNSTITVSGWTFDPDTPGPTQVHVYIDGVGVALPANRSRPDVAAAYQRDGRTGYRHTADAAPGSHAVCVHGINTGQGNHTLLGCRTVVVPDVAPIGVLEQVVPDNTGFTLGGWTLDTDTPNRTTQVHVYVDGVGVALQADRSRPDVAAAYGSGAARGFSHRVAARPGPHALCVYAINTAAAGPHTLLQCRTVVVPDRRPLGVVDSVTVARGAVTVRGWAFDPDTPRATAPVHVYVDGVGHAVVADRSRPDVGAVYGGVGDRHGLVATVPAPSGRRQVCTFAINTVGGDDHTLLDCRVVQVP